ncbi:MAG: PH domain-containing protein [Muribaculaceae bacterium]|nr:PH domain-containing protein [Muribaculaceae bacterium]
MIQKCMLSSRSLILTIIMLLLLIGLMVFLMMNGQVLAGEIIAATIVALSVAAMFYMPMKVEVTPRDLIIYCSARVKVIPLETIESARLFNAMSTPTMRLCGSGGLYGYWGWFRNRSVGTFFAYCSNLSDGILIRLNSGRQYLISPADAPAFLSAL